ncbi:hypothetical protein ABK040_010634 [Willaertia magna]
MVKEVSTKATNVHREEREIKKVEEEFGSSKKRGGENKSFFLQMGISGVCSIICFCISVTALALHCYYQLQERKDREFYIQVSKAPSIVTFVFFCVSMLLFVLLSLWCLSKTVLFIMLKEHDHSMASIHQNESNTQP